MTLVENARAVPRLSPADWRAARVREDGPVVIDRALADTPAVRTWSPEHLARSFGDLDVSVRRRNPEGPEGMRRKRQTVERTTLADFVRQMHRHTLYFAPSLRFDHMPGMLGRLDLDRLVDMPGGWAHADGQALLHLGDTMRLNLHWEVADLLFVAVRGTTRVVVEPPGSTAGRYRSRFWPTMSRVDVYDPLCATAFPDYTGEGRSVAVLDAGDVLHVPRGWWYDAGADGPVVWVTAWHGPELPVPEPAEPGAATGTGE